MDRLVLPEHVETPRLVLRRLRYEDAEEIFYAYASKPEATRYLSWATHKRVEDTRAFLLYAIDSWNRGRDFSYGIRLKPLNQLIGGFGVIHDEGKIQLGYVLSPAHWGSGYATEACSAVVQMLLKKPRVTKISTFVDVENHASIRVLEKCGMIRQAILSKWFTFVNQDRSPKDCVVYDFPLGTMNENAMGHHAD